MGKLKPNPFTNGNGPHAGEVNVLRDGLPSPEYLRSKAIPLLTGVKWSVEQFLQLSDHDDRRRFKHSVEDIMFDKLKKMMDSQDVSTQLLAIQAFNAMREMDKVELRGLVAANSDALNAMTTKHVADTQAEIVRADREESAQSIPSLFAEAFSKYEQLRQLGVHPTELPRQDIIDVDAESTEP